MPRAGGIWVYLAVFMKLRSGCLGPKIPEFTRRTQAQKMPHIHFSGSEVGS